MIKLQEKVFFLLITKYTDWMDSWNEVDGWVVVVVAVVDDDDDVDGILGELLDVSRQCILLRRNFALAFWNQTWNLVFFQRILQLL